MHRPPFSKRVFISYRRNPSGEENDKSNRANELRKRLEEAGFDVFYDERSIGAGYFYTQIFDNILAREHYILVLEGGTLDRCGQRSDWVRREIDLAMQENRNIILYVNTSRDPKKRFDPANPITKKPTSPEELKTLNTFMETLISIGIQNNLDKLDGSSDRTASVSDISQLLDTVNGLDHAFSVGQEVKLIEYLTNFPVSEIPNFPEVEARIDNLKRRILCVSLWMDEDKSKPIVNELTKVGFDVIDENLPDRVPDNYKPNNIFEPIIERDIILFIATPKAIANLGNKTGDLYKRIRFAQDYNKLIVPILFSENDYRRFSDLPEDLISLFLLNGFIYDTQHEEQLITTLKQYFSGPLKSPLESDRIADENRRRGIIAYADGRNIEGDLHFQLATSIQDATEHVVAVNHLVWGIEQLNWVLNQNSDDSKTTLQAAIKNFEKVIDTFPALVISWLYKTRAFIALEDYEKALENIDEIDKIVNFSEQRKDKDGNPKQQDGIHAEVAVWQSLALYKRDRGNDVQDAYKIIQLIDKAITTFSNPIVKANAYYTRAQLGAKFHPEIPRERVIDDFDQTLDLYDDLKQSVSREAIEAQLGDFRINSRDDQINMGILISRQSRRNDALLQVNEEIATLDREINIGLRKFDVDTVMSKIRNFRNSLLEARSKISIAGAGSDLLMSHLQIAMAKDKEQANFDLKQSMQFWGLIDVPADKPTSEEDSTTLRESAYTYETETEIQSLSRDEYEILIWQKSNLAGLYQLNGDQQSAFKEILDAYKLLEEALQKLPDSEPLDIDLQVSIITNMIDIYHYGMRNTDESYRLLDQLANIAPNNIKAELYRVKFYANEGDHTKSQMLLNHARDLHSAVSDDSLVTIAQKYLHRFQKLDIAVRQVNLDFKNAQYLKNTEKIKELEQESVALNETYPYQESATLLATTYKEIADAYRARKQFSSARDYYRMVLAQASKSATIPGLLFADAALGIALCNLWLDLANPSDEVWSTLEAEAEIGREDSTLPQVIPSDMTEVHLARATSLKLQGKLDDMQKECDSAREIIASIEKLSPNQEKLEDRLNEICSNQ